MRYAKPVPCETRDDKQAVNLVDVMEISGQSLWECVDTHSKFVKEDLTRAVGG